MLLFKNFFLIDFFLRNLCLNCCKKGRTWNFWFIVFRRGRYRWVSSRKRSFGTRGIEYFMRNDTSITSSRKQLQIRLFLLHLMNFHIHRLVFLPHIVFFLKTIIFNNVCALQFLKDEFFKEDMVGVGVYFVIGVLLHLFWRISLDYLFLVEYLL